MKKRTIAAWISILCITALAAGCTGTPQPASSQAKEKETQKKTQTDTKDKAKEKTVEALKQVNPQNYASVKGLKLPKKTYISVVGKGKDSSFWKALKKGAAQAIDDLNKEAGYSGSDKIYMTYDGPADDNDIAQQVNVLDEALARYPAALCLAPIDVQGFSTQLDMAVENSISIVAFDSGIPNDAINNYTATNNKDAAGEAARQMGTLLGGKGKIALLVHDQSSESAKQREEGFRSVLKKEFPDIQIVNVSYADDKETDAQSAVKKVLKENPDLNGYFASNENTTIDLIEACKDEGKEELVKVGFDGAPDEVKALETGELSGLMVQNPYGMGYATVISAAREILGQKNTDYVDTGYIWVTKENKDDENVKSVLY